jgi:hypothetical protein
MSSTDSLVTASLVFMEDDDALTKEGIIRTIYNPTAGTGGFLSLGMEYVHDLNPQAVMQELNPKYPLMSLRHSFCRKKSDKHRLFWGHIRAK